MFTCQQHLGERSVARYSIANSAKGVKISDMISASSFFSSQIKTIILHTIATFLMMLTLKE